MAVERPHGSTAPLGVTVAPVGLGLGALLIAWEVTGRAGWLGTSWPALSSVLNYATTTDRSRAVWESLTVTLASAFGGVVLGAVLAATAALIGFVLPGPGIAIERLSVVVHAIPLIAFAPVLITLLDPSWAPLIASAVAAYYPVYVALAGSLEYSPPVYSDLARALGAPPHRLLRNCLLPHAIPHLVDGLRLAIPAGILGAILGEWFGAPRGIGVVLLSAMQNFQIEQLWCAALLAAACSVITYAGLSPIHSLAQKRFMW